MRTIVVLLLHKHEEAVPTIVKKLQSQPCTIVINKL